MNRYHVSMIMTFILVISALLVAFSNPTVSWQVYTSYPWQVHLGSIMLVVAAIYINIIEQINVSKELETQREDYDEQVIL